MNVCRIGCDIFGLDRAREHPCGSTPTVPKTVKSERGGFSFFFFFQTFPSLALCLSAAVDLLIYFELFQALMCAVTFSCFDAGGKM